MAVPSSGELKLWDTLWNQELAGSKGENSLHSASVYAGFSTPDALSDFYGWSDVEVPTVQTDAMSGIEYYRMFANGTVNNTGNENPDRGFYFGTTDNPYTSNTKYSVGTGGTGAFQRNMDSQVNQYNVTYYAWAYACNSAGEAVGSRVSGTTPYPPFSPSLQEVQNNRWNGTGTGLNQLGYVNPYSSAIAILYSVSAGNNPNNSGPGAQITCNARNYMRGTYPSNGEFASTGSPFQEYNSFQTEAGNARFATTRCYFVQNSGASAIGRWCVSPR